MWKELEKKEKYLETFMKVNLENIKNLSKKDFKVLIDKLKQSNNFESLALRVYMYHVFGNFGRVNILINEFLNKSILENYLERIYPYNSETQIEEKLVEILSLLEERIDSGSQSELLKLKILRESNKKLAELINSEFSASSTLYLSKLLKSPNFGAKKLNIWLDWAYENFPRRNLSKYFDSEIQNVLLKHLLNLRYYYILSPEIREEAFLKIKQLKNSQDDLLKLTYFEIMENQTWNDYFSEKFDRFSIELIKQRRKFFQLLVASNKGGEYAVFKLFEMGDIQREYFIYLLAIKSYGIQSTTILPL
jgi:hypothetical protein